MSAGQIVATVMGGIVALLVLLLGLVFTIRGAGSARNAYLALAGSETALSELDPEDDTATVKLAATVDSVPVPVGPPTARTRPSTT